MGVTVLRRWSHCNCGVPVLVSAETSNSCYAQLFDSVAADTNLEMALRILWPLAGLSELVIAGWQADELVQARWRGKWHFGWAVHKKSRCDPYCRLCCRVDQSGYAGEAMTPLYLAPPSWAGQTGREMITIEAISDRASVIAEIEAELFEKTAVIASTQSCLMAGIYRLRISANAAAGCCWRIWTQDQAEISRRYGWQYQRRGHASLLLAALMALYATLPVF